jgi:uracil-DNA glycosylase
MDSGTDSLNALTWLLDAGADEAIGEEPVDRMAAPRPPLEGGPKNSSTRSVSKNFSGRGQAPAPSFDPSPKIPKAFSTLPQGEGSDSIGAAMELAASCSTLEELKSALESFDGCALKKSATHTVFADGTPAHRIMFIGEAPGHDEDRVGLPFVGKAGKLLDKMLASIGLDRASNVYITNVLNWRPPDNRNPSPEEAAMCLPFLRRHIELVAPEIVVLVGAVAVKHVLGKTDGIMRLRGKWLEYHAAGKMVPVMPTLHPAYLLRQPAHKKLVWRDLQAIAGKIKSLRLLEMNGRAV